jgi:hypothetical protein
MYLEAERLNFLSAFSRTRPGKRRRLRRQCLGSRQSVCWSCLLSGNQRGSLQQSPRRKPRDFKPLVPTARKGRQLHLTVSFR